MGLRDVEQFSLPRGFLRDVQTALQEAGIVQEERFVLLAGRRDKTASAVVRRIHVPRQIAGTHERGISVTVPGEELQRLNVLWASLHEELLMQAHSHPGVPYHSTTDDRFPMVTMEGGISIVVPLFGFCALTDLRSCAVYRLLDGLWRWVPSREVDRLIRLI